MAGCRILRVLLVAVLLPMQGWAGPRCTACDMPCCRGGARASKTTAVGLPGQAPETSTGGCPACARAAARETSPEPGPQPCRCILQARQETVAVSAASRSPVDPPLPMLGPLAVITAEPTAFGGTTPAVPQPRPPDRPTRILYGVWRN